MPRQGKIQKQEAGTDISTGKQEDLPEENNNGTSQITESISEDAEMDDLIGDLIKEELQLVLTRLVHKTPTMVEDLKKEVGRILRSRSKISQLPVSRQIKQLQELLQKHSTAAASTNLVALLGLTGTQGATQATQAFGDGDMTQNFSDLPQPLSSGKSSNSTVEFGFSSGMDVSAIRRRVRDAFRRSGMSKKRGRFGEETKETYSIDSFVLKSELEGAKDRIFRVGDFKNGLMRMEAITSEFVNRVGEVGEQYVTGFEENIKRIAEAWQEIFLHEDLDLEQTERDEWANKLLAWDSSANVEEGHFAVARYAAKIAWNNTHLKNVLEGEHIGKFKEPRELSISRINQLERQEKFKEACNLAQAVDLHFYSAKFLIKLNRLEEAEKQAANVDDAEKLFLLAQIARPLDAKFAFTLVVRSISSINQWNSENQERAQYLCDLAISSKMLDKLVEDIQNYIKHKTVQFEIAKILKMKEQYKPALEICKLCIKPYPPEPKVAKESEETTQTNAATSSTSTSSNASTTAATSAFSNQVQQEVDYGRFVPEGIARYTWDLVYEMVLLEICESKQMTEVLQYIIDTVDDLQQLQNLVGEINRKYEFDQVITVGRKMFQYVEKHRKIEHELQLQLIEATVEIEAQSDEGILTPQDAHLRREIVKQQIQEKQEELIPKVYSSQVRTAIDINHNSNWDRFISFTVNAMIDAMLDSRNPVTQQLIEQQILGNFATRIQQLEQKKKIKRIEDDTLYQVMTECLAQTDNIDTLKQLANLLGNKKEEYELCLRVCEKAHEVIKALKSQKTIVDAVRSEMNKLRDEIAELQTHRKPVKAEMKKRQKELNFKSKEHKLLRFHVNNSTDQLDNFHQQIALQAVRAAISSKVSLFPEKKLSTERIDQTVDASIAILERPADLTTLAAELISRREWQYALRAAKKATSIVNKLEQDREKMERVAVPQRLLLKEQDELHAKKQQLPQSSIEELSKLSQQLEKMHKLSYDPYHPDQYDVLHDNIASMKINMALNSRRPVHTGLNFGFQAVRPGLPQVPEDALTDEQLKQIVTEAIAEVRRPSFLEAFASNLARNGELDLALFIIAKIQERLRDLAEERKKREKPRLELQYLKQEQRSLLEQKKFLKPEQLKQLKEMELEQELLNSLLPKHYFSSLDTYDQEMRKVTNMAISEIIEKRRVLREKLESILDQELMGDKMDTEDNEEESKEKIAEKIDNLSKKLSDEVKRALRFVKNPQFVIEIARTLSNNNEYDLVEEVCRHVQQSVLQILKEKEQRDQITEELTELEQEEEEIKEQRAMVKKKKKLDSDKQKRMTELRKERDFFSILPSYSNMDRLKASDVQLSNAVVLIGCTLNKKAKELEALKEASEADKNKATAAADKYINQMVDLCLQYVINPQHMNQILNLAITNRQYDLMLKLGRKVLENIQTCIQQKEKYEQMNQQVKIYKEEEQSLTLLRKQLSEEKQKALADLESKMSDMDLPNYVAHKKLDDFHSWKYSTVNAMLRASIQKKSTFESRISSDFTLSNEQIQEETNKISELIEKVVSLASNENIGIFNPHNLSSLGTELHSNAEYELAIKVGERCNQVLSTLREEFNQRQLPEQTYGLLEKEFLQLMNQRKQLPEDKEKMFADLKLQHRLFLLKPSFYNSCTLAQYDSIAFSAARTMILSALEMKQDVESKMEMDSQMVESELELASTEAEKRVATVVDNAIQHVHVVENLMKITKELSEKLEYNFTLQVGRVCQQKLRHLEDQVKKIKALQEEKQDLLQKVKVQKSLEHQTRLNEVEIELSSLPLRYHNQRFIDNMMLQVGRLMMNAAKVTEDHNTLREQAIIIFKINISPETFGEVKVLTPESEWDKLREELLKFVIEYIKKKQEEGSLDESEEETIEVETEDGDSFTYQPDSEDDFSSEEEMEDVEEYYSKKRSKRGKKKTPKKRKTASGASTKTVIKFKRSSVKEMIELLLNEGMWKQCISVFPPPEKGNVELLERLWSEVELSTPDRLEELFPLVESYITKDYLQFEFNNTNTLLDMVSQRDTDFEPKLFEKITEKVLVNLVQKQYDSFVEMLKFIKKRMTTTGQKGDWEDFISEVKKKHKGKKKLMNLVTMADL